MRQGRKRRRIAPVGTGRVFLGLTMVLFGALGAIANTVDQADQTITGNGQGHFSEVWDLTQGDMYIVFTVDMTGMIDDYGGLAHAWSELGIRSVGYGDFNPTFGVEGAGVWLATDFDWSLNTFDPDIVPTLDLDDKFMLQKGGGMGEGSYNLPLIPPNPWANSGVWFDRDGVDPWQALMWGAVDGVTYNTGGTYYIVIRLHADSPTSGTAYLSINGLDQGFYVPNWHTGPPDLTPAGMTFTGDMTQMQVFYGLWGYGAVHEVTFSDISIVLTDIVFVDDDYPAMPAGTRTADGHYFGWDAFNTVQDGVDGVGKSTVNVAPGLYQEQVVIGKGLVISGSPGAVILAPTTPGQYRIAESSKWWEPVVFVYGGTDDGTGTISGPEVVDVDISGLTIDGNDRVPTSGRRSAGMLLRNVDGTISGNTVGNMNIDGQETFGIMVCGDSDVDILGNDVSGYSRGGITGNSDSTGLAPATISGPNVLIEGNTVTGPGLGIPVTWAPNGIQIGWGATGIIRGNTVSGNGWPGSEWTGSGIIVFLSDGVLVEGNTVVENETGVAVAGYMWNPAGLHANGTQIVGNDILNNEYGISIQDKADGTFIIGNVISGNHDGIDVCNIYGDVPEGTVIVFNSIAGNNPSNDAGYGGLWVDSGVPTVDAVLNWWGSVDGPTQDVDGDGVPEYNGGGDVVIGVAIFSPWLGIDPDEHPSIPGVQLVSPMLFVVDDVGPPPTMGYLNQAIIGANWVGGPDTIEVRHGTYGGDWPITEAVTIESETGSAAHTHLLGNLSFDASNILLGGFRNGFTVHGDVTVLGGYDASTIHINWNDLLGLVTNNGLNILDATFNWWGGNHPATRTIGFVDYWPWLALPSDTIIGFVDLYRLSIPDAMTLGELVAAGLTEAEALVALEVMNTCGYTMEEAITLVEEVGWIRVASALRRAMGDCEQFAIQLAGYGFVGGGGGLFAAGAGGATGQLTYEVGESILVYFVLTHPFSGEIIPDAVVSAAISRPVEDEYTEILFFDVAPFNEEAGEYQVEVDTTGWEPGVYDVWVGTGALDQFEHTQVTLVAPSE